MSLGKGQNPRITEAEEQRAENKARKVIIDTYNHEGRHSFQVLINEMSLI